MTVLLSALAGAGQQFFDNSGTPLAGGKLYSYQAGSTTPQPTYTSISGATPHSNPIILDSAGRVPGGEIWLLTGSSYKFVLQTAQNVLLLTLDNILGIISTTYFQQQDTAANIASIAASINTSEKFTGKLIWDSTNNRMMRASGGAANSAWWVVDGSASVIPA